MGGSGRLLPQTMPTLAAERKHKAVAKMGHPIYRWLFGCWGEVLGEGDVQGLDAGYYGGGV